MSRKVSKIKFFICAIFIINTFCSASFAFDVGGNITTNALWTKSNSPYNVISSIQVYPGVRLTIEPGVQVYFSKGTDLKIGGELVADGVANDPIKFSSKELLPKAGDWGPLKFIEAATPSLISALGEYISGSILRNCILEYGNGIESKIGIFFNKNRIENNYLTGIIITGRSMVSENLITRNRSGVGIAGAGDIIVQNNVIEDNGNQNGNYSYGGGGIWIDIGASGSCLIFNNTIKNNKASLGGGIFLNGQDVTMAITIENNL